MDVHKIKMGYTIFVFIALAAFDNIIIGLFPPLFPSIARDLDVNISALGAVSAVNILVTSLSAICWGYLSGKFNRKLLIIAGTVFWSASVFLTSRCTSYTQLFIYQIFTGIGLGCIASIGFSVLTDYIPNKYRGVMLSFWGMSQGFGGIVGALMASLIATAVNWRKPFEIVSVIGFLLIVLYVFVREPKMGEADQELKEYLSGDNEYNYNIEFKQVHEIVSKRSNVLLLIQGFFMNITTGSLIWLPTLYISKIHTEGYSMKVSVIAAGYLFGLFQVGGLTTAFFGHLGDRFQRKNYKGRATITSFFVFITAPLYVIMFVLPMNNLLLPNSSNPYLILIAVLKQIIFNPWMTAIFILSFLASAAQSANTPNWLALITDVNLPEHRGTAFSISNFANSIGRTLGNVGVGFVLAIVAAYRDEPYNYIITIIIFQIFLLPSSLCYVIMRKSNVVDIKEVKAILQKRIESTN